MFGTAGVIALAGGFASASSARSRPKKRLVGATATIVVTGQMSYTGDDAYQEDSGCAQADGTDTFSPNEDHHQVTINWKTVFPKVTISRGDGAPAEQLVEGRTTMTKSTYSLRGFGWGDYDPDGPCEGEKNTWNCSGKLVTFGKQNAEGQVVDGKIVHLNVLGVIAARPTSCLDSHNDVVGTLTAFLGYFDQGGGDSSGGGSIVGDGDLPEADFDDETIDYLASHGRWTFGIHLSKNFFQVPENCSVPDGPGVKADNCNQDSHGDVDVKFTRVKRIYQP